MVIWRYCKSEATEELLNIVGFEAAFNQAQTQVKNGDLVSFDAVRHEAD